MSLQPAPPRTSRPEIEWWETNGTRYGSTGELLRQCRPEPGGSDAVYHFQHDGWEKQRALSRNLLPKVGLGALFGIGAAGGGIGLAELVVGSSPLLNAMSSPMSNLAALGLAVAGALVGGAVAAAFAWPALRAASRDGFQANGVLHRIALADGTNTLAFMLPKDEIQATLVNLREYAARALPPSHPEATPWTRKQAWWHPYEKLPDS